MVGVFPEGGIRAGASSILEGARMRPGVAALAQMGGVPILPCVALGTDRLYSSRMWRPIRRAKFYVAFGEPLMAQTGLSKEEARARLEADLAAAFLALYAEAREAFQLHPDDLPQTPQQRRAARE